MTIEQLWCPQGCDTTRSGDPTRETFRCPYCTEVLVPEHELDDATDTCNTWVIRFPR